jgi:hypothetical protein
VAPLVASCRLALRFDRNTKVGEHCQNFLLEVVVKQKRLPLHARNLKTAGKNRLGLAWHLLSVFWPDPQGFCSWHASRR